MLVRGRRRSQGSDDALVTRDRQSAHVAEHYRAAVSARDSSQADAVAVEARLAGELAAARAELAAVRASTTWRVGRLVVGPLARVRASAGGAVRGRRSRPSAADPRFRSQGQAPAEPGDTLPAQSEYAVSARRPDRPSGAGPAHRTAGEVDRVLGEPAAPRSLPAGRRRMSQHVIGEGIEVGPGNHPYPLPYGGATVRFVDRWRPHEQRALFTELSADEVFPEPDIVANLDADGLAPVADASQDFVIASHVLEHLANPLRFLEEMHRVLRPGGVAVLLLPDRRRTFDAARPATPLEHLVGEYRADVREVDDDHLREFLLATSPHEIPSRDADWPEVLNRHRLRSVHVHCWSEHDFPAVLIYAITELGQRWELADAVTVTDGGPDSIEFGYALRKSTTALPAEALARRLSTILADIGLQVAATA